MQAVVVAVMGLDDAERRLLGRVVLAFVLCFLVGFEREVRGAPAGDRTFALIGTAAASVTAVAFTASPQTVGGLLTGIGFVGAGLVFRGSEGMVKGMTSAASIFLCVAVGIVAGSGHSALAVAVAVLAMVDLELRHLPLIKRLDARRYTGMVADDEAMS